MENDCGTEPWNINYSTVPDGRPDLGYLMVLGLASIQSTTEQQIVDTCETAFFDNVCKQKICKIEMNFARQLVIKNTELNNVDTIHANGFGPLTDPRCSVENGFDSDKGCCGAYPNRFPFKKNAKDGSKRECCGSKTYNINLYDCCADGIDTIGQC